MKLYIRSNETDEILHTILVDDDDDRRPEIVAAVLEGFDADSVYVSEEAGPQVSASAADDAAAVSALTGDGAPRDDVPGIPPEGEPS